MNKNLQREIEQKKGEARERDVWLKIVTIADVLGEHKPGAMAFEDHKRKSTQTSLHVVHVTNDFLGQEKDYVQAYFKNRLFYEAYLVDNPDGAPGERSPEVVAFAPIPGSLNELERVYASALELKPQAERQREQEAEADLRQRFALET